MVKVLLFAGTSDGRQVADYLSACSVDFEMFVATKYGEEVLSEKVSHAKVNTGRLDVDEMCNLFAGAKKIHGEYLLVVDAAHPYAEVLHNNLATACSQTGVEYIRINRPSVASDKCKSFETITDICNYLNITTGNILLTTGSKDLDKYTAINDYYNRVYVRVLPDAETLTRIIELGYDIKKVIAMQGPFSRELNKALYETTNAKYMVTKDTGNAGGFLDKVEPAIECGVEALVVNRAVNVVDDSFYSFDGFKAMLADRYDISADDVGTSFPIFMPIKDRKVLIVGGGKVGTRRVLTLLKFGADVTVVTNQVDSATLGNYIEGRINDDISQVLDTRLIKLAMDSKINLVLEDFSDEMVTSEYSLIIASTNNRLVNKRVSELANQLGILVSVADCIEESSFNFPAIISGSGIVGGVLSRGLNDHKLVRKTAEKLRNVLKG